MPIRRLGLFAAAICAMTSTLLAEPSRAFEIRIEDPEASFRELSRDQLAELRERAERNTTKRRFIGGQDPIDADVFEELTGVALDTLREQGVAAPLRFMVTLPTLAEEDRPDDDGEPVIEGRYAGRPTGDIDLDALTDAVRRTLARKDIEPESADLTDLVDSPNPTLASLAGMAAGGGLGAAIAALPLETALQTVRCGVPPSGTANDHLILSTMNVHINPDLGSGQLDIQTFKWFLCPATGEREFYQKRWVISILDGGIVGKELGYKQPQNNPFLYRLYSVGIPIRTVAYYENFKLITRLNDRGDPDPKFRYYGVSNEACINIKLRVIPEDDDHIISVAPDDVLFCAGGCEIPGIDATM